MEATRSREVSEPQELGGGGLGRISNANIGLKINPKSRCRNRCCSRCRNRSANRCQNRCRIGPKIDAEIGPKSMPESNRKSMPKSDRKSDQHSILQSIPKIDPIRPYADGFRPQSRGRLRTSKARVDSTAAHPPVSLAGCILFSKSSEDLRAEYVRIVTGGIRPPAIFSSIIPIAMVHFQIAVPLVAAAVFRP